MVCLQILLSKSTTNLFTAVVVKKVINIGLRIFNIMLKILRPILTTFFTTTAVKRLVVDLLRTICKQTTNTLDDRAVDILEKQLFPDK